jgi:hypothetical protein
MPDEVVHMNPDVPPRSAESPIVLPTLGLTVWFLPPPAPGEPRPLPILPVCEWEPPPKESR